MVNITTYLSEQEHEEFVALVKKRLAYFHECNKLTTEANKGTVKMRINRSERKIAGEQSQKAYIAFADEFICCIPRLVQLEEYELCLEVENTLNLAKALTVDFVTEHNLIFPTCEDLCMYDTMIFIDDTIKEQYNIANETNN